jgi:hypothetical protein
VIQTEADGSYYEQSGTGGLGKTQMREKEGESDD